MQIDYAEIGSHIRCERLKRKISQEKLAEIVGVGTTHISHIETGNTIPSIKTFIAIVNALNLSADELLRNHVDKSEHIFTGEIAEILKDCTAEELRVVTDIIRIVVNSLQYRKEKHKNI